MLGVVGGIRVEEDEVEVGVKSLIVLVVSIFCLCNGIGYGVNG